MLYELSPVCQSQIRSEDVAWLVQFLGCSLRSFISVTLIGSLWYLILSFRSSMPGRRVDWLPWLQSSISLWSGLFFPHVTQGGQTVFGLPSALLLFLLLLIILLLTLLFGLEVLAPLFLFSGLFYLFSVCSRCFLAVYTGFCNVQVFNLGGTLVWVCRH